jgi:hypothetical protein
MAKSGVGRRLVEIRFHDEVWPVDARGRHLRAMPRAQRRDLKGLRIAQEGPQVFARRPELLRRAAPEPVPESDPCVLHHHSFAPFGDQPMSPLALPDQECMCCDDQCEIGKFNYPIDWPPAFQEGESMQLGANFWPRFD